jgi:hypothetical protein
VNARRDVLVVLGLWLVTVVGQASVAPVAEVKVTGERVSIRATAMPISQVLDRLSRTTGMKVVYEGAPPTDRLTAAIDAGSETEALSRLLEGLGLTYAFKLDSAGRHVETLFVTSASSRRASSSSTSSTPSRQAPSGMIQLSTEDYDINGMPSEEEDPATDDPAAMVPEGMGDPAAPGYVPGQDMSGGQAFPGVEEPAFPSAASFPTYGTPPPTPGFPNPGIPSYPTFPDPVSYP